MERFDRHVGALEHPLHQRPEILGAVGVDVSLHVRSGVIDNLMFKSALSALACPRADRRLFVGLERVSIENGVLPADMLVDERHHGLAAGVRDDANHGLTRFSVATTL